MRILAALMLAAFLIGCTGTKERAKLDAAVGELVKATTVAVEAGYLDPVKADQLMDEINKGYLSLSEIEKQIQAAKAAYEAAQTAN